MGRRGDRQPKEVMNQAVRAINVIHETGCGRPGAMTAQIIMVLLHGSLKTWGEFLRRLRAPAKRRRMWGYDAAKLAAACDRPSFVYSGLAGGAWQIRQTKSKSDTMGRTYVLNSCRSGLFM